MASRQSANVTLPRTELDRIWTPEYLERLARTYWRFLTRVSLGILRVRYTADSREVVVSAGRWCCCASTRPSTTPPWTAAS